MTSLRVLIVEDEWSIAYDHATMLQRAGHHVIGPAPDVVRAMALIGSEQIDVALLDYQLDNNTSLALVSPLQVRGIPFAVVTGNPTINMPEPFRSSLIVAKPVDADTLVEAVILLANLR